jgi:hypothetical protein
MKLLSDIFKPFTREEPKAEPLGLTPPEPAPGRPPGEYFTMRKNACIRTGSDPRHSLGREEAAKVEHRVERNHWALQVIGGLFHPFKWGSGFQRLDLDRG